MMNNIGVLILSHGRPDKVRTIKALRDSGYTGEIKIVCDDLDDTLDEYKEKFGEDVIVFDKLEALKQCDTMDNFGRVNMVLPARNKCHEIAKELGWDYFFELDDDYQQFCIRKPVENKLKAYPITDIDTMLDGMIDLLEASNALCVCMSQAGDYIGGADGGYIYKGLARKAMNCYVCKTERPFKFLGTLNEDVNMYVTENMRGNLVLSVTNISCVQEITQQSSGGLTDIYLDVGTYVKSFYSVMAEPSCVTVRSMGSKDRRIHHSVRWNNCAPMILNETHKKGTAIVEV